MKGDSANYFIETAEEATEFCSNRYCECCSRRKDKQSNDNNEELEDLYDIGHVVGKGGFGTVYVGIRKSDGQKVILKQIPKSRTVLTKISDTKAVPLEVAILERLKNVDNVATIVTYFEKTDSYVIVMEDSGPCMDLFDYISEFGRLQESTAKSILRKVIKLIFATHALGVSHRDVKDENILIDGRGNVTLIDFGSGSFISELEDTPFEGTRLYSPPEWFHDQQYLHKEATVWSLGILLFDLLHGDIPAQTETDILNWNEEDLQVKKGLSYWCVDFIKSCLQRQPQDRIQFEQLLYHPWFSSTPPGDKTTFHNSYQSYPGDNSYF